MVMVIHGRPISWGGGCHRTGHPILSYAGSHRGTSQLGGSRAINSGSPIGHSGLNSPTASSSSTCQEDHMGAGMVSVEREGGIGGGDGGAGVGS